jgi:two-component system response regulator HydG
MKQPFKILIVDDDEGILTSARLLLKQHYQLVKTLNHPQNMLEVLTHLQFDLLLLDMNFTMGEQEGEEGLEIIKKIRTTFPSLEIIALTAYGDLKVAIAAMKLGVRDFITKPWENDRLLLTINNVLSYQAVVSELNATLKINQQLNETLLDYQEPIGQHPEFLKVLTVCEKVATTEAEVMITGENGTGKEIIARHIHHLSERRNGPFIKVDLGSLSSNLCESELFGHKKGAFTDATEDRLGKFQNANGGTLFLDEIGNIPLPQQAKLLTVLQQKIVTPVGSNKSQKLDVRIISATNLDMEHAVKSVIFRQDLLYRINTIEITIPPLRQRGQDIGLLAAYYLEMYKDKYRKSELKLSNGVLDALSDYSWPGNIRELRHVLERVIILSDGKKIEPQHLGLNDKNNQGEATLNLKKNEKVLILKALEQNNGNITHAARDLGIDRLALYRRLEKHGL